MQEETNMLLITENPNTAESSIIEEAEGKKKFYLEGILSTAENINKNGRKYPLSILQREFERYDEEHVKNGTAAGELNHPASASINPDRISHRITEINREGNDFYGKAIVLENDMGVKIKSFIDGGLKVGVSTRALGTVTKANEGYNMVNEDLNLICVDVVMNPSNQTSFVNGILEGIDFVMENGVIVPHEIAEKEVKSDGDDKEYEKFFNGLLAKYGVDEPDQLKPEDRKKFYDEVDKGWKSDKEKAGIAEEVEKIKEELRSAKAYELAEAKMKAFKDFMDIIIK